ncbi:MAG: Fpg/Nei family DNA glycosylase [Candidatus Abyssobacteria bacterium SURF_5]|uniref:Fpg/Nei family DNA glycosylase n=1 Tax=Abyssobacteria bacterium (strain SURF_5) TaxID=2093360 RepID=A0A3A4N2N9_ABYX5|nr:MAG: Fpg/Nei family DNA glycosylase [Candidatus Abyssubacteria bacterium SURF_5]
MPELPDVETFRRYFESTSLGRTIERVDVLDRRMLDDISPRKLQLALAKKKFTDSVRCGKYLLANVSNDGSLTLHFGMTGYLAYLTDGQEPPRHTRVLIQFTNGDRLAFVNQRIFGRVGLVEDADRLRELKSLGPDALASNLDLDAFRKIVAGRIGKIKAILMNQKLIAGIGNIYSDEILFQAGVHPETRARDLDEAALKHLFRSMKQVLEEVIECQADSRKIPESFLLSHRSRDGRCPKDGKKLSRAKILGRTAYFCPEHQFKK